MWAYKHKTNQMWFSDTWHPQRIKNPRFCHLGVPGGYEHGRRKGTPIRRISRLLRWRLTSQLAVVAGAHPHDTPDTIFGQTMIPTFKFFTVWWCGGLRGVRTGGLMGAPIPRIPGSARYHKHPVCSQNATSCESCNLAIFWHVAPWWFYTSPAHSLSSWGAHPHEKSDMIFRCMTSLMNKKQKTQCLTVWGASGGMN